MRKFQKGGLATLSRVGPTQPSVILGISSNLGGTAESSSPSSKCKGHLSCAIVKLLICPSTALPLLDFIFVQELDRGLDWSPDIGRIVDLPLTVDVFLYLNEASRKYLDWFCSFRQ